ncbi:hypothetical protein P9112_000663 [Eukaryota sp. TZLM1-RC]
MLLIGRLWCITCWRAILLYSKQWVFMCTFITAARALASSSTSTSASTTTTTSCQICLNCIWVGIWPLLGSLAIRVGTFVNSVAWNTTESTETSFISFFLQFATCSLC